jgi:hypothetical protein
MSISLVDTKELRKTGLLMQVWDEEMHAGENLKSSEQLLNSLPLEVRKYCAWGTVSGARRTASVENLGGVFEARLTSSGEMNSDNRQHAGVLVGMMTELGNELRFENKPASNDGAFRAPDGRAVKYRVAAVPTKAQGDAHCGWIAVGDWLPDTA